MEKHTNVITTVNQLSATRRLSKMSITDQDVKPEPVQYAIHPLQQNCTYSQRNSALSSPKALYYYFL
jgi:hypothetical protein